MSLYNEQDQSVHVSHLEDEGVSSTGSRKWIGAVAAASVVAVLAVGGVAVAGVMGGGGAQPEDVLPANAIAFAKLDLDPSAGQKLAAYRLISKFPKPKDKVTSEDTSIKESVFGSIFTGDSGWGLSYKTDVEPWLGDRVGVGVFPDMDADKEPEIGLSIAVTDETAARAALDKAVANAAKKKEKVGYALANGYVVVSDTTAHAAALVKGGKDSPLGKSWYAADVQTLGSDQIGVAWTDLEAVYAAIPQDQLMNGALAQMTGPNDPKNVSGRLVLGLHADPSYVELTGKGIDIKGVDGALAKAGGVKGAGMIASFPSDVFGAVTVTGLGKAAGAFYNGFAGGDDPIGVKSMLSGMGIDSAEQVETLLGTETGVLVGGPIDEPEYAVRTRGDADAAYNLALKVLGPAQPGIAGPTVRKVTGPEGIVVGMGDKLIASITSPSAGRLGGMETFKQVMPGVDRADAAAYVNLAKLMPLLTKDNPKDAASFKPLNAVGLTATGGTEPTFRLRLSVR